jgi:hypothetical protein
MEAVGFSKSFEPIWVPDDSSSVYALWKLVWDGGEH